MKKLFFAIALLLTPMILTAQIPSVAMYGMVSSPEDSSLVATQAKKWNVKVSGFSNPVIYLLVRADSFAFAGGGTVLDSLRAIKKANNSPAMYIVELDQSERLQSSPVDEMMLSSWGLDSSNVAYPWADGIDGTGVVQAILDTGFEINRPEFAGRVVTCQAVAHGTWTNECQQNISSCNHHGTHVASTAGGTTRGMAPKSSLALFRIYVPYTNNGCVNWVSDRIAAERRAVDVYGAKVINLSTGGGFSGAEAGVMMQLEAAGIVVCASAGNNDSYVYFPGSSEYAFAIAGLTSSLVRGSYSNQGPQVDFAFPGSGISGATGASSFGNKTGTSMAAPHCAGLATLHKQVNPSITFTEMYDLWKLCSTDTGPAGFDNGTGWGFPRADKCIAMARGVSTTPSPTINAVQIGPVYPTVGCIPIDTHVRWNHTAPPSWLTLTKSERQLCYRVESKPSDTQAKITLSGS